MSDPAPPAARQTPMAAQIEAALRAAFGDAQVQVHDDSAAHAGHAGAREGGHFRVVIRSRRFDNLSRLARHRLVYDSLSGFMQRGIHALAIDAEPPSSAGPAPATPLATPVATPVATGSATGLPD